MPDEDAEYQKPDILQCVFEILFTAEWATAGFGMMLLLEIFANLSVLAAAIAHVLIGDTTWDEAWDFVKQKYGYEPGDAVKRWAEEMAAKLAKLC